LLGGRIGPLVAGLFLPGVSLTIGCRRRRRMRWQDPLTEFLDLESALGTGLGLSVEFDLTARTVPVPNHVPEFLDREATGATVVHVVPDVGLTARTLHRL
jgi:hypothetical protein